jgi:hypothetical protein
LVWSTTLTNGSPVCVPVKPLQTFCQAREIHHPRRFAERWAQSYRRLSRIRCLAHIEGWILGIK